MSLYKLKDTQRLNRSRLQNQLQNKHFIEKEVFSSRKSLASFCLRKDMKHEIMFRKQEILVAHLNFLRKCPSPVFEKVQEQNVGEIQQPDLVQEMQKQLEQNSTVKNQEQNAYISHEASLQNKTGLQKPENRIQAGGQPRYWSVYLQYNVDELALDS